MKNFIGNILKKIFNRNNFYPPRRITILENENHQRKINNQKTTNYNNLIEFLHYSLYLMYLCCFPTFIMPMEIAEFRTKLMDPYFGWSIPIINKIEMNMPNLLNVLKEINRFGVINEFFVEAVEVERLIEKIKNRENYFKLNLVPSSSFLSDTSNEDVLDLTISKFKILINKIENIHHPIELYDVLMSIPPIMNSALIGFYFSFGKDLSQLVFLSSATTEYIEKLYTGKNKVCLFEQEFSDTLQIIKEMWIKLNRIGVYRFNEEFHSDKLSSKVSGGRNNHLNVSILPIPWCSLPSISWNDVVDDEDK
jgi:hypothetical protein